MSFSSFLFSIFFFFLFFFFFFLYFVLLFLFFFFFSSRRRHTRSLCDWSSDVCSSDLIVARTFERPFSKPRKCARRSTWMPNVRDDAHERAQRVALAKCRCRSCG